MNYIKAFHLDLRWPAQTPFLSCFYAKCSTQSLKDTPFESGFPKHPHAGYETLTWMRQGFMDFADSKGASARFGNGDLKWSTAGKGIRHSEMFPKISSVSSESFMECFQIWLDLPADQKNVEPQLKMFWRKDLPQFQVGQAQVTLLVGQLEGHSGATAPQVSWASRLEHQTLVLSLKLPVGAHWTLPPGEPDLCRSLYFFSGDKCRLNDQDILGGQGYFLEGSTPLKLKAHGQESCEFLLLQSIKKTDPVIKYGPFIVNTEDDLKDTMRDFRDRAFDDWPWPQEAMFFGESEGRFVQRSGGSKERPRQ